jgi:hypothetical protein
MALVYSDGKVDEKDIDQLDKLNKNISNSYAAGKISNDQQHIKRSLRKELNLSLTQIQKLLTT